MEEQQFEALKFAEFSMLEAHYAYEKGDFFGSIEWANLAIETYEKLSSPLASPNRESCLHSAMMLRAVTIKRISSFSPYRFLLKRERNEIIRWFYESLNINYFEANERSQKWEFLSLNSIRELRAIKNKLNVIAILSDIERFELSSELQDWLAIRDKLP